MAIRSTPAEARDKEGTAERFSLSMPASRRSSKAYLPVQN